MNPNIYIQIILNLTKFCQKTFGLNFPTELIQHITMISYQKIKIRCSWSTTAILTNGIIYEFGNMNRKYDAKNIKSINCYNDYVIGKSFENNFYVWGNIIDTNIFDVPPGEYYTLPYIDSSQKIIKIKNNGTTTISIDSTGKIKFLDTNILIEKPIKKLICTRQQIIVLATDNKLYSMSDVILSDVLTVKCGEYHVIAVTSKNELYGWGMNAYGNLGLGDTYYRQLPTKIIIPSKSNILSICCGLDHTMVLLSNSEIYVWGFNRYGSLGLGHTNTMCTPQKLNLYGIIKLYSGGNQTFAITKTNDIYAWGDNRFGQLGLLDRTSRLVPTKLTLEL